MTERAERPLVHVNGAPVALWPGAHWRDAVTAWYAAAGAALDADTGWLTDAAGELVDPDGAIVPGAAISWHTALDEVPDGD